MNALQGKRIVVAGGGSGIGAATAQHLARLGAIVVVGDLDLVAAQAVYAEITSAGGAATPIQFDLAEEDSIAALIESAVTLHGGLDGLFNVGADMSPETHGRDADLLDMDPAVWERTLRVNLIGFAHSCRFAIPHLLRNGGGAIVNISSGAALGGEPTRPAYAASKAGINALTRHIATRWGKAGIRCNALAPGLVETDSAQRAVDDGLRSMIELMTRSPRLGTPADIAAAAGFLFTDDAAWINGQVWAIDGGLSLRE